MSLGAKVDKLAALLQTEDKPVVVPSDHEVAKTMIHAIITAVNTNTDLDIADKLAASIRPGLTAKEFVKLWDEGQRAKRLATRVRRGCGCGLRPPASGERSFPLPESYQRAGRAACRTGTSRCERILHASRRGTSRHDTHEAARSRLT